MVFNEQKLKEAQKLQWDLSNILDGQTTGIAVALELIPNNWLCMKMREKIKEEERRWYIFKREFKQLKITDDLKLEYEDIPITSETEFKRCINAYKLNLQNQISDKVYQINKEYINNFFAILSVEK